MKRERAKFESEIKETKRFPNGISTHHTECCNAPNSSQIQYTTLVRFTLKFQENFSRNKLSIVGRWTTLFTTKTLRRLPLKIISRTKVFLRNFFHSFLSHFVHGILLWVGSSQNLESQLYCCVNITTSIDKFRLFDVRFVCSKTMKKIQSLVATIDFLLAMQT